MKTQFFTRSEGTLAYTDYGGDGDLVIMVPGMGALRSEYRFLAPQLMEAGYHPVAVDLRGHGESSVPWPVYDVPSVGDDILALIDYLDSGPAHVIATSFSPAAAVWAAVERPSTIRSLVLIGAFVRVAEVNLLMKAAFWLMMNNPWRVKMWIRFYRSLYPTQKPADFETYLANLEANLAQPGRFAANKALGESSRRPSEERLPQVNVPVLAVMGTKDPDFPDPAAEARFIAHQTNGRTALIEGAGHYPQTEMPDQTAAVILDFLRETAVGPEAIKSNKIASYK
jgi:pimeloyl-ACP methyl ester carboxylesterase